jgi:hypothetical protein
LSLCGRPIQRMEFREAGQCFTLFSEGRGEAEPFNSHPWPTS